MLRSARAAVASARARVVTPGVGGGDRGSFVPRDALSTILAVVWCVGAIALIHSATSSSGREDGSPVAVPDAAPAPHSVERPALHPLPFDLPNTRPSQSNSAASTVSPQPSRTPSTSPAPPTPDASQSPAAPAPAAPVPGAPLRFDDHPKKYLMLIQGQEGFGAWSDMVWEYLELAKTLGRTLVEPCVRNGCLEPCRCRAVAAVPDVHEGNVDELFANGADPLDLPHISYPCEPYTAHAYENVGWAYPLSAYLDLRGLREMWPHIVPYDEWCERVMRPDKRFAVEPKHGRWLIPNAYCGEMHWHECYPHLAPRTIGDFRVLNFSFGRQVDPPTMVAKLQADPDTTVMFFYAYRRFFSGPYPTVPFNPGHVRAARNFLDANFGSAPLTVLHWRSEHVDEEMLEPCAHSLSALLGGLSWPETPSGYRGLLMSDMPAPNNHAVLWHTYVGAKMHFQHAAMTAMLTEGKLLKYDFVHNATDTGVLMIRDFLFAQMADAYLTCQGSFLEDCHGCFRSASNFVGRIAQRRRERGLRVHEKVWALTQADLPTVAGPRLP